MGKKIIKLILIIGGLFLFFVFIGPTISENIPAWKEYNRIQEEQGLDSGALYYSNVPQTQESEDRTRNAVKEGMEKRRGNKER